MKPVPVPEEDTAVLTNEFIAHVKSVATGWTAGPNKGSTVDGVTLKQAKKLMGVKRNGFKLPEKVR